MNLVIIGNIISLIGCIVMVAIGFVRNRERILIMQCIQFAICGIANLILGGVTGFISAVVGIIRNLIFARRGCSLWLKILFIALQLLLSAQALTGNPIEWLPVLAAIVFTWFIDLKSDIALKIVLIITQSIWVLYDFSHLNYVSLTFDIFTILSNGVGILSILKRRNSI